MAPRTGPDAHGVTLRQLRAASADVDLLCLACMHHRILPLQSVIDRLIASRKGGPETGIKALPGLVAGGCPRCGCRTRFDARPAYPKASGTG